MKTVQALFTRGLSSTALAALESMTTAAGSRSEVRKTQAYQRGSDVLLLWGIGAVEQSAAARRQLSDGGRVVSLDVGYDRDPPGKDRMFRFSLDDPHPQRWLDQTPDSAHAWSRDVIKEPTLGTRILIVDMGPKAVQQYGISDWARTAVRSLEARGFCKSSMIHRPKPRNPFVPIPGVAHDTASSISSLLRKSSLVVTHHSNVGIEAIIHGVPVETEDGAAAWMRDKLWTYENRVSFINRLSRWQSRPSHARDAWRFLEGFLR